METLQRTANRGSISTGFDIDYSLKNESNNGERFQSANLGTPTSVRTFTFSMWVKRTEIGGSQQYILNHQANTGISVSLAFAKDSSTESLYYMFENSSVQAYGKTKALYRDTSAWMHIVWRVDTTQSTATDRVRIYVNGVDQEIESGGGGHPAHPNQNYDVPLQTTQYLLGYDGGNNGFCGYASEYVYVDGQSLAPTAFGETDSDTGIWKPIDLSDLTFGNAGYYLDFADASALGKDVGNSKGNFSHYGGSAADQATDTPTNNFAIYNQLIPKDEFIIYQGGTRTQKTTATRWRTAASTLAVANGKWYAEFQNSLYSATGTNRIVGVAPASIFTESSSSTGGYLGGNSTETTDSIGFYSVNGRYYINGNSFVWGNTWTADEIIGVALDMDNGYVYFSKNGTWQNSGDPTSGSSGTGGIALQLSDEAHYIAGSIFNSNAQLEVNYGGFTDISIASGNADSSGYGNFEYAPPSGYYALCSKNLAGKG